MNPSLLASIKAIVIYVDKNHRILYNVTKIKRSAGKVIAAVFYGCV